MNMTTIYVAGSSAERPAIKRYIDLLTEAGYAITHDWTTHEGFDAPPPGPSEEVLVEAARVDLDAVIRADVVWYVTPAEASGKSEGSAAELGAALALARFSHKKVVVSGHLNRHRIFPRIAEFRFDTHEEALAHLVEEARLWREREHDAPPLREDVNALVAAAGAGLRAFALAALEGKASLSLVEPAGWLRLERLAQERFLRSCGWEPADDHGDDWRRAGEADARGDFAWALETVRASFGVVT
jgi:hypothetical protein